MTEPARGAPSSSGAVAGEALELNVDPQETLWACIKRYTRAESEARFVRSEIGDERFERNERAIEEVQSLLQILEDLRNRDAASGSPSAGGPSSLRSAGAPLQQARQLAMRDKLKQLLLAAEMGKAAFSTKRERLVAEYIANGRQRPQSASRPVSRGSSSRPTSTSSGTPLPTASEQSGAPAQRASNSDDVGHALAAVAATGRLQFTRVHEVVGDLRELLDREHDLVIEDSDVVRRAIETEMTWSTFREPTAQEVSSLQQHVSELESQREHADSVERLLSGSSSGAFAANDSASHTAARPAALAPLVKPAPPGSLAPLKPTPPRPVRAAPV